MAEHEMGDPRNETFTEALAQALRIMLAEHEASGGSFTMETPAFYRRLRELLCDHIQHKPFRTPEQVTEYIREWFEHLRPQIVVERRANLCVVTWTN